MLTPEEEEIRELLKGYSDEPGIALLTDFTPMSRLYKLYTDHIAGRVSDDIANLNPHQFGTVITRLFPYLDEDRWKHVQRRVNGVREWGWIGLVGPASVQVQTSSGRKASREGPTTALSRFKARLARYHSKTLEADPS